MATKQELSEAVALLRAEFEDMSVFDKTRLEMWWRALEGFPDGVIRRAAERHVTTSKFKPQLADIVEGCRAQVDGQWLGADEAWALMPKTEHDSAMMTEEIAQAMAAAAQLLALGDKISARMAFKDNYLRLVERAKIEGRAPRYFASFGDDKAQHALLLANAVKRGQVTLARALELSPEHATQVVRMAGVTNHPLLAAPSKKGRQAIKALLSNMKEMNFE